MNLFLYRSQKGGPAWARDFMARKTTLTLDANLHGVEVFTVTLTHVQTPVSVVSSSDGEREVPLQVLMMRDVKALL